MIDRRELPLVASWTRQLLRRGHAEAVEVIFDPERTSYRDILEFFFQIHQPDLGERVVGSDYRFEIFCMSDEQRKVAEATADAAGLWPGKVVTAMD